MDPKPFTYEHFVQAVHSINVKDRAKWPEVANWLFETALKFKKTVKQVDK